MTTPTQNDPQAQGLTPDVLANQLFDAALLQLNMSDPREAARRVIIFLTEAIIYAVASSAGDDTARKALLKQVGDTIATAPPLPGKPGTKPAVAPAPAKP